MSTNQVTRTAVVPALMPGHKSRNHSVQFYSRDAFLIDNLSRFIGTALGAGDAAVVIATLAHREQLELRLEQRGFNVALAVAEGRYIPLDAAETLARFMDGPQVNADKGKACLGAVLQLASAAASGRQRHIAAFGEMVALLWAEGNAQAAIELEQLWNELGRAYAFSLLCGYPIGHFQNHEHGHAFQQICAEHTHVLPTEDYSDLGTEDERLRAIAQLQQQAASLKSIADERQELAAALAAEVEDLRRLHELATRPTGLDRQQIMRDTLAAAISLQKGTMGLLSLRDPEHNELRVGASIGFSLEFLHAVDRVANGGAACARCMLRRERVVIEDVETDPLFAPYREAARREGFRAVHSTPLLDHSGNLIGVLSVHFAEPHVPSEREMRLTDLYARLAVNAIENARLYDAAQEEIRRRRHAEEAMRESEQFLRSIVQSSVDCIKVLDLDARLLYMSPAGQTALEVEDVTEVLNRNWIDFWAEEDRAAATAAFLTAKAGEVGRFQGVLRTPRGTPKWWDVQLAPMYGNDRRVERLIAISREITELKRAHAALMNSEKLAAAGRLAATIAHEINNPLEAITNLFYLLSSHVSLDGEARNYARMCEQELNRVSHIVKQTLGFYRDSSKPVPVRVSEVVRNALALQQKAIEAGRIRVVEELCCNRDIIAYQGEVRQVMLNLVKNALDALPPGGTLRVRVHAASDPRSPARRGVRVTVADNGAGIPGQERAKLFQPFFSTKAERGTGLGLWVTKSIVQKHEGSIRFRSRVGAPSGTCFSIFFPAEPAQHYSHGRPADSVQRHSVA